MCSRKSSVSWRTDWETQYPGFIRANVPSVWGQLECETISSYDFLSKSLNSRQIGNEISQIITENIIGSTCMIFLQCLKSRSLSNIYHTIRPSKFFILFNIFNIISNYDYLKVTWGRFQIEHTWE